LESPEKTVGDGFLTVSHPAGGGALPDATAGNYASVTSR
jgi:hypothetical protein